MRSGADSGNLIEMDCNWGFVSDLPEGLMKRNSRINFAYVIFIESHILVWEFERDAKCLIRRNESESNVLFVWTGLHDSTATAAWRTDPRPNFTLIFWPTASGPSGSMDFLFILCWTPHHLSVVRHSIRTSRSIIVVGRYIIQFDNVVLQERTEIVFKSFALTCIYKSVR